jgi:hypothetical protein
MNEKWKNLNPRWQRLWLHWSSHGSMRSGPSLLTTAAGCQTCFVAKTQELPSIGLTQSCRSWFILLSFLFSILMKSLGRFVIWFGMCWICPSLNKGVNSATGALMCPFTLVAYLTCSQLLVLIHRWVVKKSQSPACGCSGAGVDGSLPTTAAGWRACFGAKTQHGSSHGSQWYHRQCPAVGRKEKKMGLRFSPVYVSRWRHLSANWGLAPAFIPWWPY